MSYVVVIVGAGFSAGASALWARDHGLDLETVLAINNVRNFAYFLAPRGDLHVRRRDRGAHRRSAHALAGWGGVGVGIALLLAIPAAGIGIQYGMPLWLLWWIGVAVTLLRHRAAAVARAEVPVAPAGSPAGGGSTVLTSRILTVEVSRAHPHASCAATAAAATSPSRTVGWCLLT